MPLSPSNGANSPTALGLLLRSSLYKEMVEKTTTTAAVANNDGTFEFYAANDCYHKVAYGVKGENVVPESSGADVLPLYNESGQTIWNAIQYGR